MHISKPIKIFALAYIFWLFGGILSISAQLQIPYAKPEAKYPVVALREDFLLLRTALEKVHPGIYWYTSKDSMDTYFDEAYAQIERPMTEREFYRLILPVLVQVKCGHTYPEMSAAYYHSGYPGNEYLPFELFLDGERLFIVKNQSTDSTLFEGDEILKLGAYTVAEVVEKARSLQSADGNNASWKNKFVSLFYFEEVYTEYFNGKSPFDITVLDKNGVVRETSVETPKKMTEPVKPEALLSRREFFKKEKARREAEQAALIKFRLTKGDSSAAILKISGFSYDLVYGVSYKRKHKAIFETIAERNLQNLVIDLRGNTGGNLMIAEDLMRYLVDKPFRSVEKSELQTDDIAYLKTLRQHFEKQRHGHAFAMNIVKRKDEKTYTFRYSDKNLIKPHRDNRFNGNIYVITDGWVFSAGSIFVSSLKTNRQITVVGEETGGAAVGCSGGRISKLVLPNTHLRVFFPHFRIYAVTDAKADGHGVIPDYEVRPTLSDVANRHDPEMKKVFELIKHLGSTY